MPDNHSAGFTIVLSLAVFFSFSSAKNTDLMVDTLIISHPDQVVNMDHPFIIDTTFFLFHKSTLIDSFLLDPISGKLIVTKPFKYPAILVATYQVLRDTIPLQVGPIFYSFPHIDTLTIKERKDRVLSTKTHKSEIKTSPVLTTGTFYRNVNVSPLSGTNFSGGIRLSLNGKLSDDITISGVLTDQSMPFQSEGSTQTLSEIDKIYIHIEHPQFSVTGGDISFNKSYGKYLNISRNMIGINNSFKVNKWSGDFTIGGAKGIYHSVLFFGTDGNQGPYFLTSKLGDRNIVIIAGSESVWIDGEKLTRGSINDYTIDYNSAEISFSPKNLIHFDSEIYIEYEYSDFNYDSDFLGGVLRFDKSGKKNMSLSWIQEKDKFTNESVRLNDAEKDSLNAIGDEEFILSTATADSSGDYIVQDTIFVYMPGTSNIDKYSVRFYYDENGNYLRRVSPDGTLFYEFIPDNIKSTWDDYYSPIRKISKPAKKNYYHFQGNYPVSDKGYTKVELALSQTDLNTESHIDDRDNIGLAYNFGLGWKKITVFSGISLDIDSKYWRKETQFSSIENDRDASFYTKWNITDLPKGFEEMTEGKLTLNLNKDGIFRTTMAEYKNPYTVKQQLFSESEFSFKYIPEVKSELNLVSSPTEKFYNSDNQLVLLSGNFHPFVELALEGLKEEYSFKHIKGGIAWDTKNRKIKFSYGSRDDFINKEGSNIVSQTGELKIEQSNYSGWNGKLHLIRRSVVSYAENPDLEYILGDLRMSYGQRSGSINWEGFFRLEESLTETKTVVYDSVGTGLGQYRYDPEYDAYFSDLNGEFIAFTVPTGIRTPSTHFSSSQTWNFRFPKNRLPMFRYGKIRINSRINFQGKGFGIDKFIDLNMEDSLTQLAKVSLKSEYIFRPLWRGNKGNIWYIFQKNLSGIDPRGSRTQQENKLGVEWQKAINGRVQYENLSTIGQAEVISQYNTGDNRMLWSVWTENGISTAIGNTHNFRILSTVGRANGEHKEIFYTSEAIGLKTNSTIFFGKKNRGEFSMEWTQISVSDPSISIPPEAFHGLSEGTSFTCSGQGRFSLGENVYLQLDVRFVNNKRYNNLINVNAEIRSHF